MTQKKLPPTTSLSRPPDDVLKQLLDATLTNRNTIAAATARCRLELLHQMCDQHHKEGQLDFSFSRLGKKFIEQSGLKSVKTFNGPYRTLVNSWATFAGGSVKAIKTVRAIQDNTETVDFIDFHFKRNKLLPTWEALQAEGISARRQEASETGRSIHIHRCIKAWVRRSLSNISEELILVCDSQWSMQAKIPTFQGVRLSLSEDQIKIKVNLLNAGIEQWREVRFAFEIWKFEPSGKRHDFRWLTLNRELAEWYPYVDPYLARQSSDITRKTARLALATFFVDYLFAQGFPLSPVKFLRAGNAEIPCFAETALKNICAVEIERRWRYVNEFLEYVLEFGNQFIAIDAYGYRNRSSDFHNPLPLIRSRIDDPATPSRKKRIKLGALRDSQLSFITESNPQLETWRTYAIGWLASKQVNLGNAQRTVRQLIFDYIVDQRLPSDPATLLSIEWQRKNGLPIYIDTALSNVTGKSAVSSFNAAIEFIDYVLLTYYSAEDDYGRRTISGDYHNFLVDQSCNLEYRSARRTHSNKDVLPSRYIRYLREIICEDGAKTFSDLQWARDALPKGDWFSVSPDTIDPGDPDCVWRTRTLYGKEGRHNKKNHKILHEMWSPVRAVAMILKLELPLRTFQVRLLDSGEADSWRYLGSTLEINSRGEYAYRAGLFVKNDGFLVAKVGKSERHAGVFRRMPDSMSGKVFAGLYINTNKTQDRGKEQWDRGYVVPWQHSKVLYWCERLRNWQEKYNPIGKLVSCIDLPASIIGVKSEMQRTQMGKMTFLFRDPMAGAVGKAWPIADDRLTVLWRRLLDALEDICAQRGHKNADGSRLRFVPENCKEPYTTLYPLHSLRVSLITHLATEGGVEMHILSECIAGHARILMTLYYKKSGIVYVSDAMESATARIKEEAVEQLNWLRWMKEATLKQMQVNSAAVDQSVMEAVKDAFSKGGASLLRTNLGLCATGGMGCDNGGIYINEDSDAISYGPVPGFPQQKNCVRCRWFLTGPAFIQPLVHHFNLLHFNLGDTGNRYLEMSSRIVELEAAMLECQRLNVPFENESQLENLRHEITVIYDGNEKLASDSIATMKLIVRCKHIIDLAKEPDSDVVLVAVGGMEEVTINVRECNELEQVLTAALGSTIYIDEDANKAVLKAGNAFDRMLALNGKEPLFFKISDSDLPVAVSHMTRLLQAYAGSMGEAVPFIDGAKRLSDLGLFGDSEEIIGLASAGTPIRLGRSVTKPFFVPNGRKVIALKLSDNSSRKGK